MNEISFLHANPEVHKMVQMFNDGELNHSVATCLKGAIKNILQTKTSLVTYLPCLRMKKGAD